jgi:ATP-binding protein involved in chromosome partitioning
MFAKVNVAILGIVENMSYFVCPNDGNRYEIFGSGGGEREAARLGIPLLAQIPLEMELRESADRGQPRCLNAPESATAKLFRKAADALRQVCPI